MEFWAFLGGAFVVTVILLYRSRRGGTRGPESMIQGLPSDLRNKNGGMISLPNRGRPWGRGG